MVPTHPPGGEKLLLLVQFQASPKITSYAHLYGTHNYSEFTFVPIVMEELIHKKNTMQNI